ncbi:MAG TPA: hypothetical protein DCL08_01620 [Anaerolineaceae bacterium]|nr:hypothetical protein [Anaerolineaceae bacterium]
MCFLWFGLCLLLGACAPEGTVTETHIPTRQPAMATETATITATATALVPSATAELADLSSFAYSPVFVALKEGVMMTQVGDRAPQAWEDTPDLGALEDVIVVDGSIYLLHEQGILWLQIEENQSEVMARFEAPLEWGDLFYTDRHPQQLYYSILRGDEDFVLGMLDLNTGSLHPIIYYDRYLQILGLTEDDQGLYVMPVGQDPSFGNVFVIDLEGGEIAKDLPFQALLFVALAPDARQLIAFSTQFVEGITHDYVLHLYDLPSLPLSAPKIFPLPVDSSHVGYGGLHWTPDGEGVYFTLIEDFYEPSSESYGLWYLNVETGKTHQVGSPVPDSDYYTAGISPDGEWMLFQRSMSDEVLLFQLQTGETVTFAAPLGAIFAGWQ